MTGWGAILVALAGACSAPSPAHPTAAAIAPLSLAADAQMIAIPAGRFVAGSTPEERDAAYDDYRATAGRDTAREQHWFDGEEARHMVTLAGYRIDLMPVTEAAYAEFVAAGKAPAPAIDKTAWKATGFTQDYATQVARFVWRGSAPPAGREDHPVVLVTWTEAAAYCAWRGELAGLPRRLPTADEYERALRGDGGLSYPWGNAFEASKLDCAVGGPGDTTPVGGYPDGASPFGVLGLAGNVYEWTSTPLQDKSGERPTRSAADGGAEVVDKSGERPTRSAADGGAEVVDKSGERPTRSAADGGAEVVDKSGERPTRSAADGGAEVVDKSGERPTRSAADGGAEVDDEMTVKGSAWDDYGGLGRGAARHGRGKAVRHVIIGFRCAADAS